MFETRPPMAFSPQIRIRKATFAWALATCLVAVAATATTREARVENSRLPLAFEPNVGQAASDVRFVARAGTECHTPARFCHQR